MLQSYIKTAIRFLRKNRAFSVINVVGLAIGTLCCLYIVFYVKDQYSYDRQFDHAADIYRVTTEMAVSGDRHTHATASPPIAPAMKSDFPEVLQFTRAIPTMGAEEHLLTYGEKSFYVKDAFVVDSSFFDVFNFHFSAGNANRALSAPNSIVLSAPVAERLFGEESPIGKSIRMSDTWGVNSFTVTGVVDESRFKSSLHANLFIKMNPGGFGGGFLQNNVWTGNNFTYSYVKLAPGASPAALEKKLPALLRKYGEDQFKSAGMTKILHLQPITSIHTSTGYDTELANTVSRSFLNILILIAAFIQVIACINFMNLSTARASRRAKEVGIRKVVGAGKNSLVFQFLAESLLLALAGVLIALPILAIALPYLNRITQADIQLSMLADHSVWLILAGIVIVTGLLAGSYPAFYLSAFKAVKVMKGNFTNHISAAGIRRSLVVFQFTLSIILIASIVVIFSQLNYIKHKDLGFDKDQRLIFTFHTDDTKAKMPAFAMDLRKLAEVADVSMANNYPGAGLYHDWTVKLAGQNDADAIDPQNLSSDEHFIRVMGIRLVGGRDFRAQDSGSVIINETLAKRLGLTAGSAPGTRLYNGDPGSSYLIVGVMKDFNYKSLRDELSPFMVLYQPKRDDINQLIVSTRSGDYKAMLGKMEAMWRKDLPSTPFDYIFLDDKVQHQYQAEITMSNIINAFTVMAIVISCLGLFGLAAFSAEKRTKEISIRKVLGASNKGIVGLLSEDFVKLVVIAFVIATPLAWWAMHLWLQSFIYKVDIQWWMFAVAGISAMAIALLTVGFQAIKAAVANPVKGLRSE
ncbi:MAG TPA: ABC transporter permease [Puia sp.]|jgi:putative ABC transport system permease protein|nr:ABC transporter permease [Puia sp.]